MSDKRFPQHKLPKEIPGERWTTSFANAFGRLKLGTFIFPDAPKEIEGLIRELIRDEIVRGTQGTGTGETDE